jgi:hypothetical protein
MRNCFPFLLIALFPACATMTYSSDRPAHDVSECIAGGWRNAPRSGYGLPVSLTRTEDYFFVAVELHPTFPSVLVTGTRHPFDPVWAEVYDSPSGSRKEYHRAYQIKHEMIDRIVVDCQ